MKILTILSLLLSNQITDLDRWVKLGEAEISWGYKTPYRINLMSPKGVHDIDDIRNGMQIIQFDIEWLAPTTSKAQVETHFKELIESQLSDPESIQFNQTTINRLVKKLPKANRFDRWQFNFSPDAGTHVFINNKKVHTLIGSEINRALYRGWLFRDPVTTSKLLTRLLKLGK